MFTGFSKILKYLNCCDHNFSPNTIKPEEAATTIQKAFREHLSQTWPKILTKDGEVKHPPKLVGNKLGARSLVMYNEIYGGTNTKVQKVEIGGKTGVMSHFPKSFLNSDIYKKLLLAKNTEIRIEVPQIFNDCNKDKNFKHTAFMKYQGFTLYDLLNCKDTKNIDKKIYEKLIKKSKLDDKNKKDLVQTLQNGPLNKNFYNKIKSIVKAQHISIYESLLDEGIAISDLHNKNVLINEKGDVYVIDFDQIKLIDKTEIQLLKETICIHY